MTKSLDTGQVLRTWNSGSCKVGHTLEEIVYASHDWVSSFQLYVFFSSG